MYGFVSCHGVAARRTRTQMSLADWERRENADRVAPKPLVPMKKEKESGETAVSRRQVVQSALTVTAMVQAALLPLYAGDLAEENAAKVKIAKFAENIPGYGKADVYYPDYFKGKWMCSKTLVSVTGSDAELVKKYKAKLNQLRSFPIRFVEHRGRVISDRAFNVCNEYSLNSAECAWQRDNPNVIATVTPDSKDRVSELKVTKRSFRENPGGAMTFETSEYFRTVDSTASGYWSDAPPSVGAKRELFKYKAFSNDIISAMEVEHVYNPRSLDNTDILVSLRYRIQLDRIMEHASAKHECGVAEDPLARDCFW